MACPCDSGKNPFHCGSLVDDSARLDSILELQLVLLPYSATSQTQAEELATFFDTGSVFEARFGRAS